jgi:hypothetical protein
MPSIGKNRAETFKVATRDGSLLSRLRLASPAMSAAKSATLRLRSLKSRKSGSEAGS